MCAWVCTCMPVCMCACMHACYSAALHPSMACPVLPAHCMRPRKQACNAYTQTCVPASSPPAAAWPSLPLLPRCLPYACTRGMPCCRARACAPGAPTAPSALYASHSRCTRAPRSLSLMRRMSASHGAACALAARVWRSSSLMATARRPGDWVSSAAYTSPKPPEARWRCVEGLRDGGRRSLYMRRACRRRARWQAPLCVPGPRRPRQTTVQAGAAAPMSPRWPPCCRRSEQHQARWWLRSWPLPLKRSVHGLAAG